MKRIIALSLVVCIVLALSVACLSSCNLFKSVSLEEVKANLEAAGYEITVMSGERYVESDGAFSTIMAHELDHYLYAVKGEDQIHLFFFTSTDNATSNYDFMKMDGLKSWQHNEAVCFATKQAKADAGL